MSPILKFNRFVTTLVIISVILEIVFYFDYANVFASFVELYGWLLIRVFVLNNRIMKNYPVSFLMIIGFSIIYFVLPIPLTLIELKPVTYNLEVPMLTFLHQFLFVTDIVLIHYIYRKIFRGKNVFRRILLKVNFYKLPNNKEIWLTAIIGLLSMYYIYFVFNPWQNEVSNRSALFYIASEFTGFVWMPLLIFFPKFRLSLYSKTPKTIRNVVIYILFVFIVAIVSNVRTILFSGIVFIIGLFFYSFLMGHIDYKKYLSFKKLILLLSAFVFLSVPLIDIGYAMAIARQFKYEDSGISLLKETISVYKNKELLDKVKQLSMKGNDNSLTLSGSWDETYLSNILLNRFVNLKISDNSLYYASKIGYENPKMQNELKNQILAFTPNFLLKLFNLKYSNKINTASYSIGDYLYSLAINDSSVRGSFVISSMPGIGMAIFGYWYLLVLIPIFLIIFLMFDSFVNIKDKNVIFSYLFFVYFINEINYFNDRHVFVYEFRFILRTYFESIFSYIVIIKLVRFVLALFSMDTIKRMINHESK